ncbi:hypothetical protein [Nonomuraea rubra]|uniref:hypothetical protein n=2 Tax=Streptosporangiaceae TaxID=2004 RepID=UPI0033D9CB23
MHNFIPCGEADSPDGAWCTADWVKLDGSTEEEALAAKTARFGDAQFIDQLPFDVQVGLYEQEWRPRRA